MTPLLQPRLRRRRAPVSPSRCCGCRRACVLIAVPAVAMGATFPLVARWYVPGRGGGHRAMPARCTRPTQSARRWAPWWRASCCCRPSACGPPPGQASALNLAVAAAALARSRSAPSPAAARRRMSRRRRPAPAAAARRGGPVRRRRAIRAARGSRRARSACRASSRWPCRSSGRGCWRRFSGRPPTPSAWSWRSSSPASRWAPWSGRRLAGRVRQPAVGLGLSIAAGAPGGDGRGVDGGPRPAGHRPRRRRSRRDLRVGAARVRCCSPPAGCAAGDRARLRVPVRGEGPAPARTPRSAPTSGLIYAVNTIGAIAGSLAAGFVLIPAARPVRHAARAGRRGRRWPPLALAWRAGLTGRRPPVGHAPRAWPPPSPARRCRRGARRLLSSGAYKYALDDDRRRARHLAARPGACSITATGPWPPSPCARPPARRRCPSTARSTPRTPATC